MMVPPSCGTCGCDVASTPSSISTRYWQSRSMMRRSASSPGPWITRSWCMTCACETQIPRSSKVTATASRALMSPRMATSLRPIPWTTRSGSGMSGLSQGAGTDASECCEARRTTSKRTFFGSGGHKRMLCWRPARQIKTSTSGTCGSCSWLTGCRDIRAASTKSVSTLRSPSSRRCLPTGSSSWVNLEIEARARGSAARAPSSLGAGAPWRAHRETNLQQRTTKMGCIYRG
mmetsp:Transcript_3991/g.9279  ORF Transcript_3991/g.9279 Transcript_3991/m.9279 type:complete len:232 (+) Transcript_3991:554-1249(+)